VANTIKSANFFVVGGTLERGAASYVQRPADEDLLRRTLAGEYCNVLAARQTGKSSLMVRTAEKLKGQGVKPVVIDLTSIGSMVSASEWYFGLISYLSRHLRLSVDEQAWWNARKETSPVQRFSNFLQEVILNEIREPIVIFIDEIDSTLKLKFTDDFFAAIRAAYNARSQNADLKRLTFVLLGVARPADLIKDRTRTPYNIGIGIDVTDFEIDELDNFKAILEKAYPGQGRQILEWVLEWTGGQPYLTQKLCSELVEQANGSMSEDRLTQLVERLFLGDMARKETNLRSIRDQTKNNPHLAKMLRIYKRLLANQQVMADEQSIEQNELKLAGLVKTTPQGILQVRNRIYRYIFGENWVKESVPVSTTQRLVVVTSVIAVLAIAVAGYSYYQQQTQTAEIQAETFKNSFNNTNSSEVRITSLAGLFELEGEYTAQARELFNSLDHGQQLALFDLTTPANVGNQLVVVVRGVYQNIENTPEGNALLKAMADTLAQTAVPSATTLTLEINTWLDARDAATRRDYPSAINLYTRAFEYSQDRENENAAILMERASVYTILEQYAGALADYDKVVGIDADRATEIQNAILGNQTLANYWREHSSSYLNLSSAMTLPTGRPIPTSTPALTPLPTEITDVKGVEMVLVPAGEFTMGGDANDALAECEKYETDCQLKAYLKEGPSHQLYLDAFYIDKYEVTNSQYKACIYAGVCDLPIDKSSSTRPNYYGNPQYHNYPFIGTDRSGAKIYCEWRGAQLPTEAQWEKAARGTDGRTYPWGDSFDGNDANFCDKNCALDKAIKEFNDGYADTAPVGSYKAGVSPYGIYNMAGNVWEYVADWYSETYYEISPYRNPLGPTSGENSIARGGSWGQTPNLLRVSFRGSFPSNVYISQGVGIRCAGSINESAILSETPVATLDLRTALLIIIPSSDAEVFVDGVLVGRLCCETPGKMKVHIDVHIISWCNRNGCLSKRVNVNSDPFIVLIP
jgi:formylglycine-generating enzyme required for sulfatase activity